MAKQRREERDLSNEITAVGRRGAKRRYCNPFSIDPGAQTLLYKSRIRSRSALVIPPPMTLRLLASVAYG